MNFSAPMHRKPSSLGFTIIELLVAMAITSVLIVALLSLVGNTTEGYIRTQRAVNNISQARAFIHFFEDEIETRLPATYLVRQTSDSFIGPQSSDKLAFIRVLSPDEQEYFESPPKNLNPPLQPDPGDLGGVAYYADYLTSAGGSVIPALFRKQIGPRETQDILEAGSSATIPSTDPDTDEAILLNLVEFRIQPKSYNSTGALEAWSADSSQPPSALELTIRFLDDSTAQRFKTEAEWSRLATNPHDQEKSLIRSFTRIFPLAQ